MVVVPPPGQVTEETDGGAASLSNERLPPQLPPPPVPAPVSGLWKPDGAALPHPGASAESPAAATSDAATTAAGTACKVFMGTLARGLKGFGRCQPPSQGRKRRERGVK